MKFLEILPTTMADATADGRIDAGISADPGYTRGLESGRVRAFAQVNEAIPKRFMITAWFSTRTWANQHPDAVRKFAAASQILCEPDRRGTGGRPPRSII